jgi:S-adenosylmethionine/arginine decarboxylase-like enzyme
MKKLLIQNLFVSIFADGQKYAASDAKLREFIDNVIIGLDMTVIIPTLSVKLPIIGEYKDERGRPVRPDDHGITSVTGIAESHIAMHTWPEYNLIYIEISSCKEFSEERVKEIINRHFPDNFGIKIWANRRHIVPPK